MNRFGIALFEIAKPLATAAPQQYPTPGQSQKDEAGRGRFARLTAMRVVQFALAGASILVGT
jgi:hypothetical protein